MIKQEKTKTSLNSNHNTSKSLESQLNQPSQYMLRLKSLLHHPSTDDETTDIHRSHSQEEDTIIRQSHQVSYKIIKLIKNLFLTGKINPS